VSEENVEAVRQTCAAWERGEWAARAELFDPDLEVVYSTSAFPDAGTYRGGRVALDVVGVLLRVVVARLAGEEAWIVSHAEPHQLSGHWLGSDGGSGKRATDLSRRLRPTGLPPGCSTPTSKPSEKPPRSALAPPLRHRGRPPVL
jgi:hypothetical protein